MSGRREEELPTTSGGHKNRSCKKWFPRTCYTTLLVTAILTEGYLLLEEGIEALRRRRNDLSGHTITTLPLDSFNPSDAINYSKYLVYNPSCQIPKYPPFHDAVKPYYFEMKPLNCTPFPVLTTVALPGKNSSYILTLHQEHFPLYHNGTAEPECKYCDINASVQVPYEIKECHLLNEENVTLDPSSELVLVSCQVEGKEIYKNVHILVAIRPEITKSEAEFENEEVQESMSVMIIGIDAVSKLNLMRTMPETVKYLNENNWYCLNGYHKIRKSTWNNLVGPVLTGLPDPLESLTTIIDPINKILWPDLQKSLDTCPWIFKNYSDKGYITAYAEDAQKMDSFGYTGRLEHKPTDYYIKPFMRAGEEIFNISRWNPDCIGPSSTAKLILDFSSDFANRFAGRPTFSLFWMNSFSHEHLNGPMMMDRKFKLYLEQMEKSTVWNSTMVVLMSDHGFRKEAYRETYMGAFEDSLPFLYIRLPQWFKDKNPVKVNNLIKNGNRLTSHYDLHVTLMDVLGVHATAAGCPKCVSLFDLVPWNRGCSDAGIDDAACACASYKDIPLNSSLVKRMAEYTISHLNNQSSAFTHYVQSGLQCSTFHLKNITGARLVVQRTFKEPDNNSWNLIRDWYIELFQKDKTVKPAPPSQYVIHVVTDPGSAVFEATVLHNLSFAISSLTRLDSYHNSSTCMLRREGKMYCNCEALHAHELNNDSYVRLKQDASQNYDYIDT